jgi:uncharacterized protein YueI
LYKESETIEILTEIKRHKKDGQSESQEEIITTSMCGQLDTEIVHENQKELEAEAEAGKSLKQPCVLRSKIVYDSMRSYLENIENAAANVVCMNESSEQEDETSIQETITVKEKTLKSKKIL